MWIRIDCIRIRIQVNKITKFTKHLLILKSKKISTFKVTLNILFFRFRLEKYNFLRKKDFRWLNSAFPFILSVILYLWIHITDLNNCQRKPIFPPEPGKLGFGIIELQNPQITKSAHKQSRIPRKSFFFSTGIP